MGARVVDPMQYAEYGSGYLHGIIGEIIGKRCRIEDRNFPFKDPTDKKKLWCHNFLIVG